MAALVFSVSAVTDSVNKAIKFESAMADVAKTVDGLKDETGQVTQAYAVMSKELLDMTAFLPMTAEDLAKITAAAGQAGIASADLTKFTETAAKMGVAFDVTAETSGVWMAQWRTAFSMSQKEVTTLADQINYLSNTGSEDATKLSGVVTRIGSLGQISGVSAGQVSALASSMTGVTEEISSTGIKNLMLAMTAGASATKAQSVVLDKLGFSATGMAKRMQTDAKGAILDLLKAFKGLDAEKQSPMLAEYFGKESISAIAPLLNNLGNLEENFKKVGDASLYAGSMEKEFESRAATTENKIQLAKNALDRLQITLGNLALPLVSKLANLFADSIGKISEIIPVVIDKIKILINTLKPQIEVAYGIFNSFKTKIISGFDSFKNHAINVFNNTKDSAINVFNNMKDKIINSFEFIKTNGTIAFDKIKKIIADNEPVINNVIDRIKDMATNFMTVSTNIETAMKPVLEWIITNGLPKMVELFFDVLDKATMVYDFINNNCNLIEPIIVGITAGLVAFKLAMIGLTIATKAGLIISVLSKAWAIAATTIRIYNTGMGLATAAQYAFNMAVSANPIVLICVAIGVLIGILYLVVKNWDAVKEGAIKAWKWICEAWKGAGDWFNTNVIVPILAFFSNWSKSIAEFFKNALLKVCSIWSGIGDWFNTNVITPIKDFFIPIINFIVGVYSTIWEGIKAIWSIVSSWFYANVITPMINCFNSLKDFIVQFLSSAWDIICSIWGNVSNWFSTNVITPVVSFFNMLGNSIKDFLTNAWFSACATWSIVSEWFNSNVVTPIVGFFVQLGSNIAQAFTDTWNNVCSIWSTISDWFKINVVDRIIQLFNDLVGAVSGVGESISSTLTSMFTGPIDYIKEKWNGLKTFFSGILGQADAIAQKGSTVSSLQTSVSKVPTPKYNPIKGFATGTNYSPSTFIAGEAGAELVTDRKGSKVFTALESGNIFENLKQIPNFIYSKMMSVISDINKQTNAQENNTDNSNSSFRLQDKIVTPVTSAYSSSPISITYAPNITITGGGSNIEEIKKALADTIKTGADEIRTIVEDVIQKKESRKERLSNT